MKAQTRAIIASVVVIALALSAISGVTYSWFSDTETSTIDVSSAKIDIDGSYTDVVVKDSKGNTPAETEAKLTNGNKDIAISNLVAERTITATYQLTNYSTVITTYRMYVSVDGITDALAGSMISIAGGSDSLTASGNMTFNDGIAYVIGNASEGVSMPVGSTPYQFTVKINSTDLTSSVNFQMKIVNEAYQSDYTYSPAQVIKKNGEAILPTSPVSNDVTYKGTVPGSSEGVDAAEAEITFSAGAMNAATGDATKAVTLNTKMLESEGSVAKVKLTLDNAATSDFGDNYVTVKLCVPGYYTGLTVKYDGSGDQPIVLGCDYDSSKNVTAITFKTNHFSEFSVEGTENSVAYVADEAGLNAAVGAGIAKIQLQKDIVVSGTVSVKSTVVLDLNGKTISNNIDIWDKNPNDWSLISVRENGNLTIIGDGKLQAKENDCYVVDVQDGAICTIKGGEYIGNVHAVYVFEGSLYVEGGKYSVQQKYPDATKADEFVLNCYDKNRANGTAKIFVSGGEFVNFNPADCKAEGEHTNFLKSGCGVSASKINSEVVYTVVSETFVLPEGITIASFGDNTVYDGKTYYSTMRDALNGIHKTGIVLWCKPGADVGSMTHGHVCSNLVVYGNGAFISGGEHDFEVDTFAPSKNTSDLSTDLILTVYSLNNMAVWGQRTTEYTINIILYDCKDIDRVYISGQTAPVNILIKNCSFNGEIDKNRTGLYTNATGTIVVENTIFSDYALAVNQNNKSNGIQDISLTDCTFNDCGIEYDSSWRDFTAPVRIVASNEGSHTDLVTKNCVFNYSDGKSPVRDSNYLFGDDRASSEVKGTVSWNGEVIEQIKYTSE